MENLLAGRCGTKDGHGGKAEEHREEMEEVARRVYAEEREKFKEEMQAMIYEAQCQAYEQALRDVVGVLEYDVHSVTKIGIEGCREIFEGEKAQKYISDQIMKEIKKRLQNKRFRK